MSALHVGTRGESTSHRLNALLHPATQPVGMQIQEVQEQSIEFVFESSANVRPQRAPAEKGKHRRFFDPNLFRNFTHLQRRHSSELRQLFRRRGRVGPLVSELHRAGECLSGLFKGTQRGGDRLRENRGACCAKNFSGIHFVEFEQSTGNRHGRSGDDLRL
jgi:hypothetical protein